MSEAKKFKMRPAKHLPNGKLVPVSVGGNKYLTDEGSYPVNAYMHTAWTRGDLEIDGYPEKPEKPEKKKRRAKKRAEKAKDSPEETPKPAEAAPAEDQS